MAACAGKVGFDCYSCSMPGTVQLSPSFVVSAQDYVSLSTGKPNEQFEQIARLFRERCGARWHWG